MSSSQNPENQKDPSHQSENPHKKIENIVDELRQVLNDLGKTPPKPVAPEKEESSVNHQDDNRFLKEPDAQREEEFPEPEENQNSHPEDTDAEFWKGNVLGWPTDVKPEADKPLPIDIKSSLHQPAQEPDPDSGMKEDSLHNPDPVQPPVTQESEAIDQNIFSVGEPFPDPEINSKPAPSSPLNPPIREPMEGRNNPPNPTPPPIDFETEDSIKDDTDDILENPIPGVVSNQGRPDIPPPVYESPIVPIPEENLPEFQLPKAPQPPKPVWPPVEESEIEMPNYSPTDHSMTPPSTKSELAANKKGKQDETESIFSGGSELGSEEGMDIPFPGTMESKPSKKMADPFSGGTEINPSVPKVEEKSNNQTMREFDFGENEALPKKEGVLNLAVVFPKGQESACQSFVSQLKKKAQQMQKPLTLELVFVTPVELSTLDIPGTKKAALLSGADQLLVIVPKEISMKVNNALRAAKENKVRSRVVQLEQLTRQALMADILVDLQRGLHG